MHGEGVGVDLEQARALFQKAADQGKGCGFNGLGRLYYLGFGVKTDYAKALGYFKSAYKRHYPASSSNIGQVYFDQGEADYPKALHWYLESVRQGCAEGYHAAGEAYEFGYGTSVDGKKAEGYLLGAAHAGVPQSAVDLGTLYLENPSMRDFAKALRWYSAASSFDVAKCQIGRIYYWGYGVSVDKGKAYEWFRESARHRVVRTSCVAGRTVSLLRVGQHVCEQPDGCSGRSAQGCLLLRERGREWRHALAVNFSRAVPLRVRRRSKEYRTGIRVCDPRRASQSTGCARSC
jgi:TPR repeat protein